MGGVTSGGSRDSGRNGLVPLSVAAGPEVVVTLAVQPLTAVRKGGAASSSAGAVEAAAQGDKEALLVLVWKVGKVGFGWH